MDLHRHPTETKPRIHAHDLGWRKHRHKRNGKTYFAYELRSDGTPVKCEGHPSVDLDITDDWCYAKQKGAL